MIDLKNRGLNGQHLKLVTGDGNPGLKASLQRLFLYKLHQRCIWHRMNNVMGKARKRNRRTLTGELKLIFAARSRSEGVPQIRNHGRIVLANGKVKDIGDVRPPDGEHKLDAASGAFSAWVQEKHPEALAHLSAIDGTPFISDDAAKTLIGLASESSAVTKK